MSDKITVVHGSSGGYGLMWDEQVIAGTPRGVIKCEKDLPINPRGIRGAYERWRARQLTQENNNDQE